MKVYHVTHPDHPKALMRLAVDAQGRVAKLFIQGHTFIGTGLAAVTVCAAPDGTVRDIMERLRGTGCMVRQDHSKMPANEKVALWCRLWKEYKGEKWTISGPDARLLASMPVNEGLLRWYLDDVHMPQTKQTWLWRGKQSIRNLNAYFNQVKVAMNQPAPSKHPGHWDRAHYMKLDGPGISEYLRHLKSLGLVATHDRTGRIINFIKPEP